MRRGLSLVEILLVVSLLGVVVLLVVGVSNYNQIKTNSIRASGTKERLLSGVRTLAGMPASLRNSMRAVSGGQAINPQLLACAGGNSPGGCRSGVEYPLMLFSPIITFDANGRPNALQAITAPMGSDDPLRFNIFGAPCDTPGPDCALLVYTSFKAQCAPPALPTPRPDPIPPQLLAPSATCTVAELIEVIYQVQLDPAVLTFADHTSAFIRPVTGSVVTPVRAISGNQPQ